jgi:hypothetical protein|tara:strand:+ start:1193 stop:1840 length:648 start_codon:yes stop_codon:yes gene_type:complete
VVVEGVVENGPVMVEGVVENDPVMEELDVAATPRPVFHMLKCNRLNVTESDANYKRWKESARKFDAVDVASGRAGGRSVNQRYTSDVVTVSLQRMLEYLQSTNTAHSFSPWELESEAACLAAAEKLVRVARNSSLLEGCVCWQDTLIQTVTAMVDGKENLVHGFLEGLSKDQLVPYLNAVHAVQHGQALKLLIHAPPGCGKTYVRGNARVVFNGL